MKSEKPKIIEMFDKLPKVVSSCETEIQLVFAQRYAHLSYRMYEDSRVLRILGDNLIMNKRKEINAPVVERYTR